MEKELKNKLKEAKQRVIDAMGDNEQSATMVDELISLQKQADVEPVELIVPCKEVVGMVDFEACKIIKTIRGFLFSTKGGFSTFVGMELQSTYQMIELAYNAAKEHNKDDDDLINAVCFVMQAPIFASISDLTLYTIAGAILKTLNIFFAESVDNATLTEETEDDIKNNIAAENFNNAVTAIAEVEIPEIE